MWPRVWRWGPLLLLATVRAWVCHVLGRSLLWITLWSCSRREAIGVTLVSSRVTILDWWARVPLLLHCGQLGGRLSSPRWARAPQTVAPHHTACPTPEVADTPIGRLPPHHLPLHLDWSDSRGVQHWLRTMGGIGSRLRPNQRSPLLWKTHKFPVVGVEASVNSVLKI